MMPCFIRAGFCKMVALLAMAFALGLLVLLMHLKIKLGRAMLASALALALLLRVTPSRFWTALIEEWHSKPLAQTTGYLWISLTALAMLVNVLGIAMKEAGFEFDFALLIFGAMLFKLTLQGGQAVDSVVRFFYSIHAPPTVLIFVLPFAVASLTGVTVATVAMAFPFLIPFIGTGSECRPALVTLAFSGVICGLLLTPVHLCLALSTGYFACSLTKIIQRMLVPTIGIAGAGVLMAWLWG